MENNLKEFYELEKYAQTAVTVKNMDNFLQLASAVRLMFHNYIYSDMSNINSLMSYLNELDLFNIEYEPITKQIQLKIKKTNMKKYHNYSHTVQFYYTIFNDIMTRFLNERYTLISDMLAKYGHLYGVNCTADYILDQRMIGLVYNITTILDNIIIIYL